MSDTASHSSVSSIEPLLSVRRGAQAIAFYKMAFEAKELFVVESSDGAVVARLEVAGARFWLSDESPENGNFSPETLKGSTVRILLVVPDPDAVFSRAVSAGGKKVHEVADEHGWRIGRIEDPFGHHWEICKELGRR